MPVIVLTVQRIGVDFGEAYEIPNSLEGVPFYAAVVLKVVYLLLLCFLCLLSHKP